MPAVGQKPDIRIDYGGFGGSVSPALAVAGSAVYATWVSFRAAPLFGPGDIYFNRSLDGGATWLPADVRLDTGRAPGSANVFEPDIAAVGPAIYVVWRDYRNNPGRADLYFNRSFDAGTTWLPTDVRLNVGSAPGTGGVFHPRVAAAGTSVYVTWEDMRSGNDDIYLNRSADGGLTWLAADVRLDVGSAAGAANSVDPRIAAAGSSVHVAWSDRRNDAVNGDIYYNGSSDGGQTWLATDVRLDVGSAPGAAGSDQVQLAASGTAVHAVWQDYRNGNSDIYYNGSTDGGATWLPADVRLDSGTPGASGSWRPDIAADGSAVYVAWEDLRNSTSVYVHNANIYLNRSLDNGATWLPADLRLDHGPPTGSSQAPRIAVAGPSVGVAWQDFRDTVPSQTRADVYWNRSLDGGSTWLPVDVRLNVHAPAGTGENSQPSIVAGASSAYALWNDRYAVYFALATGFQPYGAGTAGSSALVPTLSGSGHAAVGSAWSLEFGNGLGGAPALAVFGVGPASITSQPLLGGTLLVSPAVTLFFLLGGPPGVPGAGSFTLPMPPPTSTILLGLDVDSQGLFLDSGAAGSVSMSNGLQTWIG